MKIGKETYSKFVEIHQREMNKTKERRKEVRYVLLYMLILGIITYLIISGKICLPWILDYIIPLAFFFGILYSLYKYLTKD